MLQGNTMFLSLLATSNMLYFQLNHSMFLNKSLVTIFVVSFNILKAHHWTDACFQDYPWRCLFKSYFRYSLLLVRKLVIFVTDWFIERIFCGEICSWQNDALVGNYNRGLCLTNRAWYSYKYSLMIALELKAMKEKLVS